MIAFKSWQQALMFFIERFGSDYQDSYNLVAEFENHLFINRNGTCFLRGIKSSG